MSNTTSRIVSSGNGVILPQTDKVLYLSDIEKKIEKTNNQLVHLEQKKGHRNTHGGKTFRARAISIEDQKAVASQRLQLLQSAKDTLLAMSKSFPGLPATLNVDIQTKFDPQDSGFLTQIWRFYNQQKGLESLINRVEVWQDRKGIALIQIYFMMVGCEQMLKAFAHYKFVHMHKNNWCSLEATDRKEMRDLLELLKNTHQFIGNAKSELELIQRKL